MSSTEQVLEERSADSFTSVYVVLTFAYYLLIAFSDQIERIFNLYIFLVPLLLIPGLLLLVAILVSLTASLVNRRWRRAVSVFLAPALAAVPLIICGYLGVTPTWLRFQLERPYYEREIARIEQREGMLRLMAFPWGDTGGATVANVFHILVYDESDEIDLPPDTRSAGWVEQAKRDSRLNSIASGEGEVSITPLGSHFFEVVETYQ